MSENVQDYVMSYSFERLEETARTFRRLGEAYETVSEVNSNTASQDELGFDISKQLLLVADVLEDCVTMSLKLEDMDKEIGRQLFKKCFLAGIRIKSASMVHSSQGVQELLVWAKTMGHGCISTRKLLSIVNQISPYEYYEGPANKNVIGEHFSQYVFVQENRFKLLTGVARKGKGCSRFNGDNFLISKLPCGKTIAAIADGMGSGKRAFLESRMVIELMENCIDAGFEEQAALDLINSAYIAGGGQGVNPVTMDMSILDCRAGLLTCLKMGAAATFIKRDNYVEIIKSTTLPLGVLSKVDSDKAKKKMYSGDYVVMVSDGLLDNLPGVDKEAMMAGIISDIRVKKPDAMAEEIMKKSLAYKDNVPIDDMTVLILGVFDTYDKS